MKKIKVLVLITVFAFAALGGAYAMWADQLVIKETVETGYLNVEFGNLFNPDPGPNYTGYDGDVYGVTAGNEGLDEMDNGNTNNAKNIASMEAAFSNQTKGDAGAYNNENDVLTITLDNGYPGYQERIFTTITNNGTVPAKFDISTVNALSIANDLLIEIWFDADPTKAKDNGEDFMIWSNSGDEPEVALDGYQIDPGESIPVAIYTRVKEAANQDATYEFSIKLNAIQWNGYNFEFGNDLTTMNRKDPLLDPGNGVNVDEPKFADFNK
ncbi:MAG TPA: hypothetical protein DDW83_03565 [Peptococcaceae bacterium]|nr:hypothetical protein [Peptococcaceae bacterium]